MKKFKILKQPTRIDDLRFDDDNDLYDRTILRTEKIHAKALRQFKHQLA